MPDELFKFYLLSCPYAKSDKSAAPAVSSLNLAENGWTGPKLHQLMQWISLQFIDENQKLAIHYLPLNDITNVLKKQGLVGDTEPPATASIAYLSIANKLSLNEQGQCKLELTETYITCLFRHIRNSLAHGNYQELDNSRVALYDTSSKPGTAEKSKKYTFAMVTSIEFLQKLMKLVSGKAPMNIRDMTKDKRSIINSYRIKIDKSVIVEDKRDET